MNLEDAIIIIEEHHGDMELILRDISDKNILKQLMRIEDFSDKAIEYFSRNPKIPEASILFEILQEISREETSRNDSTVEEDTRFKETVRIYKGARDKYLFSFRGDLLAKFLIEKLRLSPLKSAGLGLILVLLTYAAGLMLHFIFQKPIAGITKSFIDFIYDVSIVPVVFGYYVWISTKAGYLFLDLKARGTALKDEHSFDDFVAASVNKLINRKLWIIVSAATAIISIVITDVVAATYSTVWGPRDSSFILLCLWKVPVLWGVSWYMIIMIFLKETATIISLRRLLKKKDFSLNVYHDDRHGGLRPILDFATRFSYFIMACGFGFILLFLRSFKYAYFQDDIFVNIGLLIYIGLACFFFFFPLSPAQRLFKKLKNNLSSLDIKSAEFDFLPPLRPATVLRFALISSLPIVTIMLFPLIRLGMRLL